MPADKSKITESLWTIVEQETARLLALSTSGGLDDAGHDALANMARVTRTLSLHNPGEDAYVPAKDAKELREALDLLEDDGGVIE